MKYKDFFEWWKEKGKGYDDSIKELCLEAFDVAVEGTWEVAQEALEMNKEAESETKFDACQKAIEILKDAGIFNECVSFELATEGVDIDCRLCKKLVHCFL